MQILCLMTNRRTRTACLPYNRGNFTILNKRQESACAWPATPHSDRNESSPGGCFQPAPDCAPWEFGFYYLPAKRFANSIAGRPRRGRGLTWEVIGWFSRQALQICNASVARSEQ
jgi:hypothetical protein